MALLLIGMQARQAPSSCSACTLAGPFVRLMSSDEVCEALGRPLEPC